MPSHLQPACCIEADDQAAIKLWLQDLRGVKAEFGGARGGFRREPPDHLAMLRRVLIDAECISGILLQRKSRRKRETFLHDFGGMYPIHAEVQDCIATR